MKLHAQFLCHLAIFYDPMTWCRSRGHLRWTTSIGPIAPGNPTSSYLFITDCSSSVSRGIYMYSLRMEYNLEMNRWKNLLCSVAHIFVTVGSWRNECTVPPRTANAPIISRSILILNLLLVRQCWLSPIHLSSKNRWDNNSTLYSGILHGEKTTSQMQARHKSRLDSCSRPSRCGVVVSCGMRRWRRLSVMYNDASNLEREQNNDLVLRRAVVVTILLWCAVVVYKLIVRMSDDDDWWFGLPGVQFGSIALLRIFYLYRAIATNNQVFRGRIAG